MEPRSAKHRKCKNTQEIPPQQTPHEQEQKDNSEQFDIKIVTLNVDKGLPKKSRDIANYLLQNNVDFCTLQEANLSANCRYTFEKAGYKPIESQRENGGVILIVKEDWFASITEVWEPVLGRCLITKFSRGEHTMVLAAVYLQSGLDELPKESKARKEAFLITQAIIAQNDLCSSIVALGDFNSTYHPTDRHRASKQC